MSVAAMRSKSTPAHPSSENITVITRDNIRVLHPHGKKRNATAVVLRPEDVNRIKNAAVVITKDQELARSMAQTHERVLQAEAARERRLRMEEFEKRRTGHLQLSDVEREAKEKANYLLAKAQLQMDEEEDDIKRMNELILYAKCVAIRDAQVDEKIMIHHERKAEEQRLDAMMEAERQADLRRMEQRHQARLAEMRRGAQVIQKQISERHEAALLEAERRDQETKATLATIAKQAAEDKAEKLNKLKAQRELMHQVVKANTEAINKKKQQKSADQEEDRRLLQYLIAKEKKEMEKDREAQARKAEREKELSRLRAAQQRATDKQAEQDALRAKRATEAYEREWRRKELETAEKKAREEAALRAERARQQEAREAAIAVEASHLRQEFLENVKQLAETEARIKREEQMKIEQNRKYSLEVQRQIAQREAEKKKEREEFFMEGIRLESERRNQRAKIDGIRSRKLNELRSLGVPDKYCKEVERKMLLADKPGRLAP
ncbi:tumor suppressor, Mitostatin-domain-containing protein [Catenaria anguillulae PL171]|uniref:Cilia- and flagella-associated protein 45 n=1 Tax=Catenaria anguillulae PL171 TaxID=765915 RepID=A0A1Y2HVX3_9FUNG|nr:tumor suppressor, Mitostatin-domain-containing protein [Catenaria anguillulae PL171]